MLKDRIEDLKKKLGGDKAAEEKASELLQAAEAMDKAGEQARLQAKEAVVQPPAAPPEKPVEPKGEDKPVAEQPGMFVADMTPEEFDAHVAKAATAILTPIVKEIGDMVKQLGETQAAAMKESGATITKQFETITTAQSALDKRLADLEGLKPRMFRASQAEETKIDEKAAKELAPHGDKVAENSLAGFIQHNLGNLGVPVQK